MKYDESHLAVLAQIYSRKDTTVNNLAQDAAALATIATELHARTGAEFLASQALDALLYARKRGTLPRLRRKAK